VSSHLPRVLGETFTRNPGMAARLMRAHVDDGTGHCAGCGSARRATWLCVLVGITARANEAGGRRDDPPAPPDHLVAHDTPA
jgi:hypothetical protein